MDFTVQTPAVTATNAWAGQNIGILFLSTVDTNNAGGIWDMDNVRLVETTAPALGSPAYANGVFSFNLLSEPGAVLNVLTSSNLTTPGTNWLRAGPVTNTTGSTLILGGSTTNAPRMFYRLQQL